MNSDLTAKEAKHLSRLLLPPKRGHVWFSFVVVTLAAGMLALMSRRLAALSLIALVPIPLWVMSLVRDRLRHRLTVRAGIVFVLLATAATFTLTYVMLPVVTGVDFGAFAPGLVGGFAGFALYTWRTYGPLWRKVGRRRIAI